MAKLSLTQEEIEEVLDCLCTAADNDGGSAYPERLRTLIKKIEGQI